MVAVAILVIVGLFFVEGCYLWLPQRGGVGSIVAVLVMVTVIGTVIVRTVWSLVPRDDGRDRRYLVDLTIAAAVSFVLIVVFGHTWFAGPSLVAGAGTISLRGRTRWVFLLATLVLICVAEAVIEFPLADSVEVVGRSAVTTTVLGGMGLLVSYATEIHANRAELARMAVIDERLRFARDLHDLLGRGLSVVRLKAELATARLGSDDAGARAELAQIIELTGSSATELRALIKGYRHPTLPEELRNTVSILALAGIEVTADDPPSGLPAEVAEAVCAAIREAGTNVLRHSSAGSCRIAFRDEAETLEIDIRNDNPAGAVGRGGHGLTGLTERFAGLGGTLAYGSRDGEFVLTARIPLPTRGAVPCPSEP